MHTTSVEKSFRGCGIAVKIGKMLLTQAKNEGCDWVYTTCTNNISVKITLNDGFEEMNRISFCGNDVVGMAKKL